jgi:deoxyribonuclease-2
MFDNFFECPFKFERNFLNDGQMLVWLCAGVACRLSCKDPLGADTDWWAAVKEPHNPHGREPPEPRGAVLFYRDGKTNLSIAPGSVLSTTENPLYHTLKPVYSKQPDVGYFFLSDQPPDKTVSSKYSHSKGVIFFDKDNGVWLPHAVPKFPPDPKTGDYAYPSTGIRYAQSFECMTLDHANLESLAYNMMLMKPYGYSYNFPSWAGEKIPSLKKLIDGETRDVTNNISALTTVGGQKFTMFAKSSAYGKDIYHDLIAPEYKSNIYSLTWALGTGTFPSDCSPPFEAHNIMYVSYDGVEWKRTQNHAKLALVGSAVCFGDVNRQHGQLKRGGAMYCKPDSAFAKEIAATIVEVQQCNSTQ